MQSTAPVKINRYATSWRGLASSLDRLQVSYGRQDPAFKTNLVRPGAMERGLVTLVLRTCIHLTPGKKAGNERT